MAVGSLMRTPSSSDPSSSRQIEKRFQIPLSRRVKGLVLFSQAIEEPISYNLVLFNQESMDSGQWLVSLIL